MKGRDVQGQTKPDHWGLVKFDLLFFNVVCVLLTVPLLSISFFLGGVTIIIITIAIIITSLQQFF